MTLFTINLCFTKLNICKVTEEYVTYAFDFKQTTVYMYTYIYNVKVRDGGKTVLSLLLLATNGF